MGRSALVLCLVSGLAFGQDAPRAFQVQAGTEVLVRHPDWVFTKDGKGRVDAALLAKDQEIAQLKAEKAVLEAVPALTWKGVAAISGVTAVVVVVATVLVYGAARR